MNLSDLRMFVGVTQHASLHAAATHLNVTPSALSKAIRRLEDDLRSPLFDRSGKTLQLNAGGQRLLERALVLLHLADQTRAEFEGADYRVRCRIAAPALLQWRYGTAIAEILADRYADSSLVLRPTYENEALAALMRGEVDFALVTGEALATTPAGAHFQAVALGALTMQLAAGLRHPLAANARGKTVRASRASVFQHDFVCPTRSMFCGIERGMHSDGWRDEQLPRRIRYWVDDLQVLLSLVQSGKALAYLPQFAVAECGLVKIQVRDMPIDCSESAHLVWRPAAAAGWQSVVVEQIQKITMPV
ncbi:MAG TPA: LysR family transcriptional regulator [Burkholderiaceae bacterium]|jgi:DNA-binding transcriptional LysR family regulator|nr:LysR family transcriptional regulator [Burkholderiaceae bacterium]